MKTGVTVDEKKKMTTVTMTDPKATVFPLLENSAWPDAADALAHARALPIPTTRSEAWKYTRVAKLFAANYTAPSGNANVEVPAKLPFNASRLVFVNGVFRADLSDDLKTQKGVVFDSLQHHLSHGPVKAHYGTVAPTTERLFTAMNTSAPTDGLILLVTKGVRLEKPIHVLNIVTDANALIQPRDLLMLHEGAKAEVIFETIGGSTDSLFNAVRESFVGDGAELTIHLLQNATNGPTQIGFDGVQVQGKGRYSIDTTTLDGSLIRNEVHVALAGPEAHVELNGVYVLNGTTHCDNHTYIGHNVPDCTSDELYKGIVAEKGTGVFNGKVYVKRDAQRTRAYQSNANILQGDDSKVYTKPELEIYADDVKCSHGCTIGRMDEQALFYLRSRGVSEPEARKIMAQAFASDVLERVSNEDWRVHLHVLIDAKLALL